MFLNKINKNEIPGIFRNKKLLERFLGLIILRFGLYTSNTGFAKFLYIFIEAWLEISVVDKFQYFILTKVAS